MRSEVSIDSRRADYWLAKTLAYDGALEEAADVCRRALESCRRQRTIQQDDARLRTLEIDLQELSAELAALDEDLATPADQYRRVLEMRRKSLQSGVPPEQFLMEAWFKGSMNADGLMEPGPFCGYVETHLRLADILRRSGGPYEAECILGECSAVTAVLVAERPQALRYRIADANVFALSAELLADRRPAESEILYRRARQIWAEAAEQFPHAKEFVSGVHGLQSDWKYFEKVGSHFTHLPEAEPDEEEVNTNETVWHQHNNGRSWARVERWESSIRDFEKSVALRTEDHAYDWLHFAIGHAHLGQHEEAQEWFEKAVASIEETTDPHSELIELRDATKSIIENLTVE